MREQGYAAGQTAAFEYRFAEGRHERLLQLARELVERRVASRSAQTGGCAHPLLPLQDFPKLRCQKAFEQEPIGTKSEEELFNESRRALSASAANRRTHVYIRETVTTRIFRNQRRTVRTRICAYAGRQSHRREGGTTRIGGYFPFH